MQSPPTRSHLTRRRAGVMLVTVALFATACASHNTNEAASATPDDDPVTSPPSTTTPSTTTPPATTEAATTGDDIEADEPAFTTSTSTPDETTTTTTSPVETTTTTEAIASVDCTTVPTGVTEFVLDAGGAEHDVRVYVPTTYDGDDTLPLVMNFHGFGSTGNQQAVFTGYEDLAEVEDFIVVHPTGVPGSRDPQQRNSWQPADLPDPEKDDLAFTIELLDLLIADYCVDKTRVYSTGMSGGGLFTSRLVCDMSDRLAAAVSVAAIAYSDTCDPERAVPFIAIHGTDDPTVPFDGYLAGTRFEGERFAEQLFDEPIPDQFTEFAAVMGCDLDPERVQESADIIATTYTGCDDDVPLIFYEVVGGGHSWPSSPLADLLVDIQGYTTFDIDATADSWAFFEQHTLDI